MSVSVLGPARDTLVGSYGSGRYGETGGYGGSSGSYESGAMSYAVAFAKLLENCGKATEVYGKILGRQNDTTETILNKMEKISNAKAELVKLIAAFPVPKDDTDKDPTLSSLGDKLDRKALGNLNQILGELNMDPVCDSCHKSDLDSLQTRLTGAGERLSGEQGMQSTKTNFYLGKITANETMSTNVVKAEGSLEMTFARNTGQL